MSTVPFSKFIDGFQVPGSFSEDDFRSAIQYKALQDDLFLVAYPKCGTTWTSQIIMLILRKGEPLENPMDIHIRAPFLEKTGAKFVEDMQRPGLIKTHLPFHLTPWSKDAKYICVIRNPKDCCVSYYYHLRNLPGHNFEGTFDQFFELFISGKTDFGDYFDHLMSWYPHRNKSNVLFIKYEELKENFDSAIFKIASFIDDDKYAESMRNDPSILSNIKKYSSLEELRCFMVKSFTNMTDMTPEELKESSLAESIKEFVAKQGAIMKVALQGNNAGLDSTRFVRKGIIGDWRNHFSENQNYRINEIFLARTKDTDIQNFWKKYM